MTVEDAVGNEIDLKDREEDYLDEEAMRRRAAMRQRDQEGTFLADS